MTINNFRQLCLFLLLRYKTRIRTGVFLTATDITARLSFTQYGARLWLTTFHVRIMDHQVRVFLGLIICSSFS